MSPRKPVSDSETRERILAAAEEVFASIGFGGARIDDIAARAGVNKAMLYYHVGDKERLYSTVLVSTIDRGLALLQHAAGSADSPAEKLTAILSALASFGAKNPHFIPIMLREVASGGAALSDEMLARMAAVFRVMRETLDEGRAEGVFRLTDPLLTHLSLVGSTIYLVATTPIRERLGRMAGIETHHTPEQLAEHTANLMLHGLQRESAPARTAARKRPAPGRRSRK